MSIAAAVDTVNAADVDTAFADTAALPHRLPATVLSGFLGAGKTTLLNQVLRHRGPLRVAVIVNDMSELNIDAGLVRDGAERAGVGLSRTDEAIVEMSNGCICCTLRDDLLKEVGRLAREGRFDYLLIESTGISEPMPIAATFDFVDEHGQGLRELARIDTMVTVVDALNLLNDYASEDFLAQRDSGVDPQDGRRLVELLVEQIEFANVVVVSKTDLVDAARLAQVHAVIQALNPGARIIDARHGDVPIGELLGTGLFDMEKAESQPRWIQALEGHDHSEADAYGLSSFVYRAERPFDAGRLHALIARPWPGLLRFKGYVWLASRLDWLACLSGAGRGHQLDPVGRWSVPLGERGQELVLIGQDLDIPALTRALDACLSSTTAPAGNDPWPAWDIATLKKEPTEMITKKTSRRIPAAALAAGLMMWGAAQAHGDKHEHGVVHLDVAIEGDTLAIQLESPLDSVLGFERQPRTPAERQSVDRMLATLRGGAVLFTPDARGQCRFEEAQLESALIAGSSTDSAPGKSEHLDVDVSYRFRCAAAADLSTLSHQLFALFPRIQRIDAQVATPKGQSRQVLKRPDATLSLGG